jgi:DNA-binding NtrC family response regulator
MSRDLDPQASAGTIVLVEDNDGIRFVMTTMLQSARYVVHDFADANAAIEMLRSYPGPVDLLVTDAVLPRMNGADVATAAIASRPELPVLFMSGHPESAIRDRILTGPNRFFLGKPFDMTRIADHIATLLSSRSGAGR